MADAIAGGADSPLNMQWQTVEEGSREDRDEWKLRGLEWQLG